MAMSAHRIFGPALAVVLGTMASSLLAQTDTALRDELLALRDELLALRDSDQFGRVNIQTAAEQHGSDSPEVQALVEDQLRVDETNLTRLREIIAQHGWPSGSMVGREGSIGAFLILQHADHETQLQYIHLVRAAVEAGELDGWTLALLQDRILVREGKPQVYGSQLRQSETTGELELYPIEDEANVDSRRAELGMMPLAEYVRTVRGDNQQGEHT